jgi:hypothetical protein
MSMQTEFAIRVINLYMIIKWLYLTPQTTLFGMLNAILKTVCMNID